SDSGSYDPNDIPENMQAWLEQYVEEIASLDESKTSIYQGETSSTIKAGSPVAPLIQTKWGQGRPYYFQCPKYNGYYCVTGCVATAMAQVMYYYQWPDMISREIPAYHWDYGYTTLSSLAGTSFNWNAMKKTYSSSDTVPTATANFAVAKLMRYCGQSVEMNYSPIGSSAPSQNEVYVDYFKYSPKARKLIRFDYSYSQWESFILNELRAHRPVVYVGHKYEGGHCFVCDGYDGSGYYHFNWGWSGDGDGYFLLTSLNPDANGIGSAAGNDGYMISNEIIIGLEPNTISTNERNSVVQAKDIVVNSTTYTRSSSSDPFAITIGCRYYNYKNNSIVSRNYDLSWGVYDESGFNLIATYGNPHNATLGSGNSTGTISRVLNFGKNYGNGTYYLRPICRENGGNQWLPCHYSGLNYVQAEINGNTLTLMPVNKGIQNNIQTTEGVSASIYSYGTVRKVNRPLEVTVKVNKNCLADNFFFYLWANNTLVGANTISLDGNSIGYVTISYTPTKSGTNNLEITADRYGNYSYCTGSVDVETSSEANLSKTYNVSGANSSNNNTRYTRSLPFHITIKNNKNTVYRDYIIAQLYKKVDGSDVYHSRITKGVKVTANGTVSDDFTFTNLEPGEYRAEIYYYSNDDLVRALRTITYKVAVNGDVNGDGVVSSVDVTALYNYLLNGDTSAIVNGDQDGDGIISSVDITIIYNILLGN
ncbi:MAG: C10 family peptidase, partial [Muribaculaceae bacterium]|nr:C10 family peptidase [Muribaculaceae bacterium]